ncbi:MAG: methionine adenosyltransferase [Simkaniaceae bacterium]|nr:methionine adenosyltransferase [Simkaniaceae bacterium]
MRGLSSEAVQHGHPDKIADAIADHILDAYLLQDPKSRVACEVLVKSNRVVIAGEITANATVDYAQIAKEVYQKVGYDPSGIEIQQFITEQGSELAQSMGKNASGDQVIAYGYAVDETEELLPLTYLLAQNLARALAINPPSCIKPDGKILCTSQGDRLALLALSLQSAPSIKNTQFKEEVEAFAKEILKNYLTQETAIYINQFFDGGPEIDAGLTGRKIMVDTYGTLGPHGGGGFSGKDPTKMDRAGAYAARYLAKNLVASGLLPACSVQLTYAIGIEQLLNLAIDPEPKCDLEALYKFIAKRFPLTPSAIIERFELQKPIYSSLSFGGHFTNQKMPWEQTDLAHEISANFLL